MASPAHEVTRTLLAWDQGEQAALDELISLAYRESRRLVHRYVLRDWKLAKAWLVREMKRDSLR